MQAQSIFEKKLVPTLIFTGVLSFLIFSKKPEVVITENEDNEGNTVPFFFPPTPLLEIREDTLGSGLYKARRSGKDDAHQGIDITAFKGTRIVAPFDGEMVRIAPPYENDGRYFGMLLRGKDLYKGYEMKLFYLIPTIVNRQQFFAGDEIGIAQSISQKWGSAMLDHIHIELRYNGRLIDPTPLFFNI